MATGGPWDADPFWYAKNGYEWSDANGWVRVRDAAPSPLYPDSRDATISSLRAELEVSEATNKAKTLMLADSGAALATAVESLELYAKDLCEYPSEEGCGTFDTVTCYGCRARSALAAIKAVKEAKT